MHAEPLLVVTFGPRDDVGGAQQGGIGDAGDRAAATPVIHQRISEDVLANALDYEVLGLGILRQSSGFCAKPGQRLDLAAASAPSGADAAHYYPAIYGTNC